MIDNKTLTTQLKRLEQELKDDGIDLNTLRNKVDELKEISIQVAEPATKPRDWIAYCITCHTQLESCPNGAFAEAAAKLHLKEICGANHIVIVGKRIK